MSDDTARIDHKDYCDSGGYCDSDYESWAAFTVGHEFTQPESYSAIRFDWYVDPATYIYREQESTDPREILRIVYVYESKGEVRSVAIRVTEADEPDVRAYLTVQWERLHALWAPVSGKLTTDKRCVHCDALAVSLQPYTHTETIDRFTTSETRDVMVCSTCGEVQMTGGELAAYQRRAALAVLECNGAGSVLRYARKALGHARGSLCDAVANVTLTEIDHGEEYGSEALRLILLTLLRQRETSDGVTVTEK